MNLEEIWLPVDAVALLENIAKSTVTRRAAAGKYTVRRLEGDGRNAYLIQLASLSRDGRTKWLIEDTRRLLDTVAEDNKKNGNFYEREAAAKAQSASQVAAIVPAQDQETPTAEEVTTEALWATWEAAPESAHNKAHWRVAALVEWQKLQRRMPIQDATAEIQHRYEIGKSALYEWQALLAGQKDQTLWPLLLLDKPRQDKEAAFSEAAWQYILAQWGTQNRPKLAAVYRRAKNMAAQQGWDLPSYATVRRRIDALPAATVLLMREGPRAVEEFYPPQQRDRAAQTLHDVWCVDGHKLDIFVRNPANDTIYRPVIVGFMDERSRVLLGYAIGDSETGLLTRNAFVDAIKKSHTLPQHVRPDNGRAFAGKFMSGGIKNRYRGKVKEEELTGIWTALQIEVIWAQPYSGRSKMIESFWRVVAENVCKRPEFAGAYTGNKPDARPDEWDKSKAVDLAVFEAAVNEEFSRYHNNIHRGDGMDGRSPIDVYTELLSCTPQRPAPTPEQMRMLMLCAQAIKLDKHHVINLLGNRYFADELAQLPYRATVDVRFDGGDLATPVHVYHLDRYLCTASPLGKVGVHDKEAAKAQAQARKRLRKSAKEHAQALTNLGDVFAPVLSHQPKPDTPDTGPDVPVPNVVQLRTGATLETPLPVDLTAQKEKEDMEKLFEEGRRLQIAEMHRRNGTR